MIARKLPLVDVLRADGVSVRFGARVLAVHRAAEGAEVEFNDGTTLAVERIIVAAGRHPNTDGLGVEHLGIEWVVHQYPLTCG